MITVTIDASNPDKIIRMTGTSSFGRAFDFYFGLNGLNVNSVVCDSAAVKNIEIGGDATIGGTTTASGEIISENMDAFRMVAGDYGAYWRFDGYNLYLLLTDSGDQYGQHNNLRPLTVSTNGGVTLGTAVAINNGITFNVKNASGSWCNAVLMDASNYMKFGTGASTRLHLGSSTNTERLQLFSKGRIDLGAYGQTTDGNAISLAGSASAPEFRPCANNKVLLGSSSYKWTAVYATNGTIQTSDETKKTDIQTPNDVYYNLAENIDLVQYRFKETDQEDGIGRIHIGAISQQVESVMTDLGLDGKDFAGFCKDKKTYEDEDGEEHIIEDEYNYSLRYDELAMLKIWYLEEKAKKQQTEINELKTEVAELKEFVSKLIAQ